MTTEFEHLGLGDTFTFEGDEYVKESDDSARRSFDCMLFTFFPDDEVEG